MNIETYRWVIELLLTAGACVMWFLMRKLIADVTKLEAALSAYKLHVAENYVTQGSLTKAIENMNRISEDMFRKLERIEDKLDKKVDK